MQLMERPTVKREYKEGGGHGKGKDEWDDW